MAHQCFDEILLSPLNLTEVTLGKSPHHSQGHLKHAVLCQTSDTHSFKLLAKYIFCVATAFKYSNKSYLLAS